MILARAPERGRVKTRLQRTVGADAALAIYRQLLRHTAAVARQWPGEVLLASTGDPDAFAGVGFEGQLRREQASGGLGTRIAAALQAGCELGDGAIVIGTDCPGVEVDHLRGLRDAMGRGCTAFGPARDGGFWGLGTDSPTAIELLATPSLPWSSPNTLEACREVLARKGIATDLGAALSDVDTIEDLRAAVQAGQLSWPADLLA